MMSLCITSGPLEVSSVRWAVATGARDKRPVIITPRPAGPCHIHRFHAISFLVRLAKSLPIENSIHPLLCKRFVTTLWKRRAFRGISGTSALAAQPAGLPTAMDPGSMKEEQQVQPMRCSNNCGFFA